MSGAEEAAEKTGADTEQREYVCIAMGTKMGGSVSLFVCPFCYSVSMFPAAIFTTGQSKCLCGARFTQLGLAMKAKIKG
jgi:hypothetical protein